MSNYGILLNQDAKLHRKYFNEMVKLLGIQVGYISPMNNKEYNLQGELESAYNDCIKVGCIFEDHIDQNTAKKLGWDSELVKDEALIHVPYDLPDLQIGALFIVPSGFDNTPGRCFRVVRMSAIMVYPASISCAIVPEYQTTVAKSETKLFTDTNFNLLYEGEPDKGMTGYKIERS